MKYFFLFVLFILNGVAYAKFWPNSFGLEGSGIAEIDTVTWNNEVDTVTWNNETDTLTWP